MAEVRKKHRGDTKYAYRVRKADAAHLAMPFLMGQRIGNEALCKIEVDSSKLDAYIKNKNDGKREGEGKYTYLHAISAAFCRVVELRPKMNYYYKRNRLYERKDISVSFVVKKEKKDNADENFAAIKYPIGSDKTSIDVFHDATCKFTQKVRKENYNDGGAAFFNIVQHLPVWLIGFVIRLAVFIESFDILPKKFMDQVPYTTTCFITNLGSIKMNAEYHHLINFGSNSIFMVIGAKYKKPEFHEDGTFILKEVIPISITIDERIADGVYFANSLNMLSYLLQNPEILDKPVKEVVDIKKLLDYEGLMNGNKEDYVFRRRN